MRTSNFAVLRKLALLTLAVVAGLATQESAFAQKGGRSGGNKSGGGMQFNSGNRGNSLQQGGGFKQSSGFKQSGGFQQGNFKPGGNQPNGNQFSGLNQGGGFKNKVGGFQQGTLNPGGFGSGSKTSNPAIKSLNPVAGGKIKPVTGVGGAVNPIPGKGRTLSPFPKPGTGIGSIGQSGNSGNGNHNHHNGHNQWKHLQNPWCHKPHRELLNHCNYVRTTPHLHWNYSKWCNYYPTRCHWWYNWCGSSYYFDPSCCVSYNWYYYPCTVVYGGVTQQYSWHLGMNCVFIPGRGLGVQEVEVGSPAELAGFQPGMVLVAANGLELTTEGVFQSVIESSNGLLTLAVMSDANAEITEVGVQMTRLVVNKF